MNQVLIIYYSYSVKVGIFVRRNHINEPHNKWYDYSRVLERRIVIS